MLIRIGIRETGLSRYLSAMMAEVHVAAVNKSSSLTRVPRVSHRMSHEYESQIVHRIVTLKTRSGVAGVLGLSQS